MKRRPVFRLPLLLLVAALSGFCVMVLEFAAVRMLAPAFGQANQVWANVIGAILLAPIMYSRRLLCFQSADWS